VNHIGCQANFSRKVTSSRYTTPVPTQKYLDTEVWCPVSGFKRKDGSVIPPHKVQLMICADGNLYARCPVHLAKSFIQDGQTIKEIVDASNVIRTKEKRVKELKNATS
jgi:hypothetical protein